MFLEMILDDLALFFFFFSRSAPTIVEWCSVVGGVGSGFFFVLYVFRVLPANINTNVTVEVS